jgi:integrase
MAKVLTQISIQNMRAAPKQYERPDGGCRGLRVVVHPTGNKSFILRFRHGGRTRKLTLGSVLIGATEATPQLGAPMSLAGARALAAEALRKVALGGDPAAEKVRGADALPDTFRGIAEEFLRRRGPKLRTLSQRKSDLELCYPSLGSLPVAAIKRGQYTRVFDHIADNNGPVRADRTLAAVKCLLTWHAERSDFLSPLGRGGRRIKPKDLKRKRTLSDDELRRLWLAAEAYSGPFGAYLRFTTLTATRRGESAGLRWDELSDAGRTWIIPGAKYKTDRDIVVPLSDAAQRIVAAQPRRGAYVFSADGSRPLGGFGDRKKDFDKVSGVKGYRLHDLRRTARTLLGRAGISADIGEKCLGHVNVGVRDTYDRHEYQAEKTAAFEALAALVERIVRPPAMAIPDIEVERVKRGVRR